jgi:hypothetical protein
LPRSAALGYSRGRVLAALEQGSAEKSTAAFPQHVQHMTPDVPLPVLASGARARPVAAAGELAPRKD